MAPLQARLHNQISNSMVLINIKPPIITAAGRRKFDKGIFVMGTIIVLQPHLMYIVADPSSFHGQGQFMLVVDCLEGTILQLSKPQIHLTEGIAGIFCPNNHGYNTERLRAVPLCRSIIAKCQDVHLFSLGEMLLTSGTVMGVSGRNFQHNCSGLESSALGAPVVDDDGHLVGICNDFRNDYLEAISTHAIASEIEEAQGRQFISIDQMLGHLQSYNRVEL